MSNLISPLCDIGNAFVFVCDTHTQTHTLANVFHPKRQVKGVDRLPAFLKVMFLSIKGKLPLVFIAELLQILSVKKLK